jgi:peptidase M15-like protein
MNPPEGPWLLICPADDYRSAREFVGASAFRASLRTAEQLGAVYTWDEAKQKLYVRDPDFDGVEKPADKVTVPAGSVVYPSGSTAERHPENNHADYKPAHPSISVPLVKLQPDIQVSEHFRLSEFRAKSAAYDGARVHPNLVRLLEKLRAAAGSPIHITSGYRPPKYNAAVGGVSDSYHQDGVAADIYSNHLSTAQLHAVCSKVLGSTGGLGYYPSQQFVHVDVGPYARWQG